MKYPEIQQIIDTMDKAGYDYKSEVVSIQKASSTVNSGVALGLNEHTKAMILALLSNEGGWVTKIQNKSVKMDLNFSSKFYKKGSKS